MEIHKVLVVCTGNICRSPLAEAVLKPLLQPRGITVESAGTHGVVAAPAHWQTEALARQQGIDLSRHRAQALTPALMKSADLILALDQTHRAWMLKAQPQLAGRIYKLGHWSGNADVEDPYGQPESVFLRVQEEIIRYCKQWPSTLGTMTI